MWDAAVPDAEMVDARAEAQVLMLDAGKALRPTGGYEYVDGEEVLATEALFGSGEPVCCKIKPPRLETREADAGGRTVVTIPGELHIPADPNHLEYAAMTVGDLWEIVTVAPTSLTRVGRRYRITSETDGTSVTACRYAIERVVS